jgi:hypothetical protein
MASRFPPPETGQQAILGAEVLPRLSAPPWQVRPPGAIPFIFQDRQVVTGSSSSDVSVVLARAKCPQFYVGVVRELAYQINDLTAGSNVEFALRINQAVNLDTIYRIFPRVASHVLVEFDPNVTFVRLPEFCEFDVLVTVRAGDVGTYLVGAVIRGWWYPEELERA